MKRSRSLHGCVITATVMVAPTKNILFLCPSPVRRGAGGEVQMKVEVVPYNPEWVNKYLSESALIKQACGDKILIIEHAGSTSVVGLAAKPIIDIYIGTKSLADAHAMIPSMLSIGYEYIDKFEDELPFRRYFRKSEDGKRAFHIHVTPAPHYFRNIDLIFRDYVSINENARQEYAEHKIELSKIDWPDEMLRYNKAKDEICLRLKADALKYFGDMYEETEALATYLSYTFASDEMNKKAQFRLLRDGGLTAKRTDLFEGFSLNRALGITSLDEALLDKMDKFYEGKKGKAALQIPPNLLNDEKITLLNSRGYEYSNSWITFYRDSSPIQTRGTDLEVRMIGKDEAHLFGHMLNEVFGLPHEMDEINSSAVGEKGWATFMAFDGDKPAGGGSICVTGETSYLNYGYVLPEYRRRGVQGELMKKRIDAVRELGAKWVFVDTAEDFEDKPNPSYWNMLRHGFRLLYHRPNYAKTRI